MKFLRELHEISGRIRMWNQLDKIIKSSKPIIYEAKSLILL